MSRRAVVPEFPQSIGASGCAGPRAPQPLTVPARLPSGLLLQVDLARRAARTASMDERTSSESSTPDSCEVPSAMAENSTARCDMRLVARHPGDAAQRRRERGDDRLSLHSTWVCSFAAKRAERNRVTCTDELDGKLADVALVGEHEGEHRAVPRMMWSISMDWMLHPAELGDGGDLGHDAGTVGHGDAHLQQLLGRRHPGRGERAARLGGLGQQGREPFAVAAGQRVGEATR